MRNIEINQAETIFEPFWDSGESYPNHQKYSCIANYRIENTGGSINKIEPMWCGVRVSLGAAASDDGYTLIMERDCRLSVKGYDILRLSGMIPKQIRFRILCVIDGVETIICEYFGKGKPGEYDGVISGELITKIRIEYQNTKNNDTAAILLWMGLSNAFKQHALVTASSPYDSSWEGCFADEAKITPQAGIFFNEEELIQLREKVNNKPFLKLMDQLRRQAEEDLLIEPEKEIGDFVPVEDKRWVRERDSARKPFTKAMERLAFVGIVDKNIEMLRKACAMALSLAHCTYWCESIIGVFPGATWHHRSFTEEACCRACCAVLDWAGGLLSWHGKNIIYDAIIMKGLPRLDADVKTMDYIWDMNQGIIFNSSIIMTLLLLQKKYPRYEVRLQEAERDFLSMWKRYCLPDGGITEGPSYWNYTMSKITIPMMMLARHRNKSLQEYVQEYLDESFLKSSDYALLMLSDLGNGTTYLPINDARLNHKYSAHVAAFFADLTGDERWHYIFNDALTDDCSASGLVETLLLAKDIEVQHKPEQKEHFVHLPNSGHTSLKRMSEDVGMVRLFLQNSPMMFGHSHEDKGSFVLEAGGFPMLIDRGVCNYDNAVATIISKASWHNLLIPESEQAPYRQNTTDPKQSGVVQQCVFDGTLLRYAVDITNPWGGIFTKNVRKVASNSPNLYFIYDEVVCSNDLQVYFNLNTYGEVKHDNNLITITYKGIQITVYPMNWIPSKIWFGEDGVDGDLMPVNQLRLYSSKKASHSLVTVLEVSCIGAQKLKLMDSDTVFYDGILKMKDLFG